MLPMTDMAQMLVADAAVMTPVAALRCGLASSPASVALVVLGGAFGEPSHAVVTAVDGKRNC